MPRTWTYYPKSGRLQQAMQTQIDTMRFNQSTGGGNLPQAPSPTIDPPSQTATNAFLCTISSLLGTGTIYYTLNGDEPSVTSTQYTGPFYITADCTLKAIVVAPNYSNSAVSSETYVITVPQVGTPTFTPIAGTYPYTQDVTISAFNGTMLYYTIDGSDPVVSGTRIAITPGDSVKVLVTTGFRAYATAPGYTDSAEGTAVFIINNPVPTPVLSPVSGTTFSGGLLVTATCSLAGADMWYTTDGITTPTQGPPSTFYTGPFTITDTTTLKFKAFKVGYTDSAVATYTYTSAGTSFTGWFMSSFYPYCEDFYAGAVRTDFTMTTAEWCSTGKTVTFNAGDGYYRYFMIPKVNVQAPLIPTSGGFVSGGFNLSYADFAGISEGYNEVDGNGWPYFTFTTIGPTEEWQMYRLKNQLNGAVTLTGHGDILN